MWGQLSSTSRPLIPHQHPINHQHPNILLLNLAPRSTYSSWQVVGKERRRRELKGEISTSNRLRGLEVRLLEVRTDNRRWSLIKWQMYNWVTGWKPMPRCKERQIYRAKISRPSTVTDHRKVESHLSFSQCCQKVLLKSSQISVKSSQTYNLPTFLATFKNKKKTWFIWYFGRSFSVTCSKQKWINCCLSGWLYRDEISQSILSELWLKMAVHQMAGNKNIWWQVEESIIRYVWPEIQSTASSNF